MKIVHIGLIVFDLEVSAHFYEQILGLSRIERPDLNFDGLWYGLDQGQQIHLMRLENPYVACDKPGHGGRDNHVALWVDDFDAVCQRLTDEGISCTMSRSGRKALFCRDPDGNTIELMG